MLRLLIGDNPLHEKYPKQILGKYVVQAQTSWKLRTAGLNSETEVFIIVVKGQRFMTIYYRNKFLKNSTDPMCMICNKRQETIDHLAYGYSEVAKAEDIEKPNKSTEYLYWAACEHYKIKNQRKILWIMQHQR